MKLNFIKVSPTENMTVLITDQVPRKLHAEISNKIMNYNNLYAEQVGFIEENLETNQVRLQMMGGEFCGNATRALASVLVFKNHNIIKNINGKMIIPLEVSGTKDIHYCEVMRTDSERDFISSVNMPIHTKIEDFSLEYSENIYYGTLVTFPGIIHLIVDSKSIDSKKEFFIKVKNKLDYLNYEALGIMFFDKEKLYIEPIVYVRATDSVVWERGCGSGTAAIGVYLSYKNKISVNVAIKQPGGELEISTKWYKKNVVEIVLSGIVTVVAEGVIYLD